MVVAVAKAARGRAPGDRLRLDRQHLGVGGGLRRARPGIEVVVVLPKGQIAIGKLLQALIAGARVVADRRQLRPGARGSSGRSPSRTTTRSRWSTRSTRIRLEGQKTAAFEICDDLGRAPDVLAIPVGNAGNISAYWAGLPRLRGGRR